MSIVSTKFKRKADIMNLLTADIHRATASAKAAELADSRNFIMNSSNAAMLAAEPAANNSTGLFSNANSTDQVEASACNPASTLG